MYYYPRISLGAVYPSSSFEIETKVESKICYSLLGEQPVNVHFCNVWEQFFSYAPLRICN